MELKLRPLGPGVEKESLLALSSTVPHLAVPQSPTAGSPSASPMETPAAIPFPPRHPRSHSDIPDDLFTAYINPNPDSSENENEADSSTSVGHNRPAAPMSLPPRHCRSLSMDSFVGKVYLPPSPFEFGNGEFNAVELNKIASNEKLAEIALSDPRRVKRILANRQSAARSKERKMRYISELEHKVQTLQTEATTLSAQLTLFQRDYSGLTTHNNELKFRLQAMDQQAKLRDALNDALTGEVQRLKLAAAELGETELSNSLNQQIQLNPQAFQLKHAQFQQQSNSVSENKTN